MYKNPKGFFLVELLLSLSIWIMMTVSLLPLYIHVSKQAINTTQELEATHLLYEALHFYLLEGHFNNKEEVRGGYSFHIDWQEAIMGYPIKVCVMYENAFRQTKSKCESLE